MNESNEKFSLVTIDFLGWGVPPLPSTGRLDVADLLQWSAKPRHFGVGFEVEIPAPGAAPPAPVDFGPRAIIVRRRESFPTVRIGP